jgi:hypothetical protein
MQWNVVSDAGLPVTDELPSLGICCLCYPTAVRLQCVQCADRIVQMADRTTH